MRDWNATEDLCLPMGLCICSPCGFLKGIRKKIGSAIRSQSEVEKNMKERKKEKKDVNMSMSEAGGTCPHDDAPITLKRN